jgi:hypothetical protein
MIPLPAPNTRAHPYRGLSVQEVDVPLDEASLHAYLLGREVYRRTEYLALRRGGGVALVAVRKAAVEPLFSPVVDLRVLAGPDRAVWVESPSTDVGNATALAAAARESGRSALAYVVLGRFEHVNFLWRPEPLRVRVVEVVPPHPAKLLEQARQVVAFDEDLPPVDLVLDAVDLGDVAAAHPAGEYLVPCRGSGVDVGVPTSFLDTRPAERRDWTLLGCERSMQFHRHFYGDEPPQVDICPRNRVTPGGPAVLAKCCLLERGVELSDGVAVVPWGADLDEVRDALRFLAGLGPAAERRREPASAGSGHGG